MLQFLHNETLLALLDKMTEQVIFDFVKILWLLILLTLFNHANKIFLP